MKWTCHKCNALNPGLAWRCHQCKTWCPEEQHALTSNSAVLIHLPQGVEINMTKVEPVKEPEIDLMQFVGSSSEEKFPPLKEVEKNYIVLALDKFKTKTKAAEALGITIKTLYNKLHEYDLWDKYKTNVSKS